MNYQVFEVQYRTGGPENSRIGTDRPVSDMPSEYIYRTEEQG